MGNTVKPPKEERISARVSYSTKRKLNDLPYSYGEVLEIGAEYLSNETNRLTWEKAEIELDIANLRKELSEKEAKLVAINNRLRIINPKLLDGDTLNDLIDFAASDYAMEVFQEHKNDSLRRISIGNIAAAVRRYARESGYDPNKFYDLVVNQLKQLCHTQVSDNSAEVLNDIV